MRLVNLTEFQDSELYRYLPKGLEIDKLVFMPDFTPLQNNIPTGTAVRIKNKDWRKYAISDIGCGISVYETQFYLKDFKKNLWDKLFLELKNIKRKKYGSLGSGNHFLDLMKRVSDDKLFIVIHTGSPFYKNELNSLIDNPSEFDKIYKDTMDTAIKNREKIAEIASKYFGELNFVFDKIHNSVEKTEKGVIIRKGCVKIKTGELTIIPSSMTGKAAIVKANENIKDVLLSLSHGTGRVFTVGESKTLYSKEDYAELRNKLYIPEGIGDSSFAAEVPEAYRELEVVLELLKDYIDILYFLKPIAYIGQLW